MLKRRKSAAAERPSATAEAQSSDVPEEPVAIQVDVLALHDDGRVWIEGWSRHEGGDEHAQVAVKSCGGDWTTYPLWRYRRPDVAEHLGLDPGVPFGFCGWLGIMESPTRIQMRVSVGHKSRSLDMEPQSANAARDYVLDALDVPSSQLLAALRLLVQPMIRQEATRGRGLERELIYSRAGDNGRYETNVVIPLYGNFNYLRNIMQWASVAPLRDSVFTLVCDDPDLSQPLQAWLGGWNELVYKVPVRLFRHSRNAGFAAACNTGWQSVASEFTVFWNSDLFPISGDDVLGTLKEALQVPDVSAIAPVLLYPDGSIQHAGMTLEPFGLVEDLVVPDHWLKGLDPAFLPTERYAVDLLSGAFIMMRSDFVESVGGMPEDFGAGDFEDVLLSMRLREKGRLLIDPTVRLRHLEGVSFNRQGNGATMKTLARSLLLAEAVQSEGLGTTARDNGEATAYE